MKIKISIKELIEFVLRSGSLDNRYKGGFDRAVIGSRIHRQLQKKGGENYKSEVHLKIEISTDKIDYILQGRADGIITTEGKTIVDEIKTVTTPLEVIDEEYNPTHWGQAIFYGYIYSKQNKLENIDIQLTYYNIDHDTVKKIIKSFTFDYLEEYVLAILKEYEKWAELKLNIEDKTYQSLEKLTFPFKSYRDGQKSLATAVYNTINKNLQLIVSAPTGIGKTMSTIFPALKAKGNNLCEKIFYLTAKGTTAASAVEAVNILKQQQDLYLITTRLTSKEKMCLLDTPNCNPESCPYADKYFDKVNGALYEILQSHQSFDYEQIIKLGKQYNLCPHELSLDLSIWSDIIIGDYNYLFDPTARLQRFFENGKNNYTFLIDEVHNLPDRCRDMYSANLLKNNFYDYSKKNKIKNKALKKAFSNINSQFLELKKDYLTKETKESVLKECPKKFKKAIREFVLVVKDYIDDTNELVEQELLDLYFDARFFVQILEEYDEDYSTIISRLNNNVEITLFCINPKSKISNCLKDGQSAIMFSATLTPIDYYKQLMGDEDKLNVVSLKSPFPQENLRLFLMKDISLLYNDRQESIPEIASAIHTFINCKKGNYLAYFPSYKYMQDVYNFYIDIYEDDNVLIQSQGATDEEKVLFLNSFEKNNPDGLLGFCVLGGIYSEGIDLKGDKLLGSVIIGTGIPMINNKSDLVKDYYNEAGVEGYNYAYQYPGMNKVLQAAGRVIRTETDKGAILLIDKRFSQKRYLSIMPNHWNHGLIVSDDNQLNNCLTEFWNKN